MKQLLVQNIICVDPVSQWFLNLNIYHNNLEDPAPPLELVWGGAWELAFLTSGVDVGAPCPGSIFWELMLQVILFFSFLNIASKLLVKIIFSVALRPFLAFGRAAFKFKSLQNKNGTL